MSGKDVLWSNPRPVLTVERGGGGQLGNCYYGSSYRITTLHALDLEEINAIRDAGFIGGGQEFYIRGQEVNGQLVPVPAKMTWEDWEKRRDITPSGVDKVGPTVRDRCTGKILDEQAVNAYTKEPITDMVSMPYFVYITEDRVDSSD